MKPIAAPGMHYRIFPDPASSKHYTAVLLKDHTYLEVYNIDTPGVKTKFATLEEWHKARGETSEVIRDKNDTHIGIKVTQNPEDGFKVLARRGDTGGANWLRWCYGIISEAAPELFENEEVKKAYNNVVYVCAKYPNLRSINTASMYIHRYSENNIKYGLPWYLENENKNTDIRKWYTHEEVEKRRMVNTDITPYYNVLYSLIADKIMSYMKRKEIERKHIESIKNAKKYIKNAEDIRIKLEKGAALQLERKLGYHYSMVEYYKKITQDYNDTTETTD
jgi:hypothetical protein